jgi:hypothetical protein
MQRRCLCIASQTKDIDRTLCDAGNWELTLVTRLRCLGRPGSNWESVVSVSSQLSAGKRLRSYFHWGEAKSLTALHLRTFATGSAPIEIVPI